jgi:translation initiation factor 2 subunit 2
VEGASGITADDLDFSDIKKKKKSSKKKPAFDLKEFEKELNQSKSGADGAGADEEDEGEGFGENNFEEIDEAELGENPFARATDAPVGVDAGNEAWLKSDRDYTYSEARVSKFLYTLLLIHACSS